MTLKLGYKTIAHRLNALNTHLTDRSEESHSMSPPATTRRVITGHNSEGTAIFESDEVLTTTNPFTEDGTPPPEGSTIPGFTLIHKTEGYPVKVQGAPIEYHGKIIPLSDATGTVCRIVDFPPIGEADREQDRAGLMHRTQSLDFAIVMKGTIKLELDDGVEKEVKEGDVVVQRATIHSWKNYSKEPCRIAFVLIPSEQVRVEATGEVLEPTRIPALEKHS